MARLIILLAVAVIGATAPARAWCEATCVAPVEASESHCPTHPPSDGTTTITAEVTDACPVLESARPPVPLRLDVGASPIDRYVPAEAARRYANAAVARAHRPTTVFERSTPLRI